MPSFLLWWQFTNCIHSMRPWILATLALTLEEEWNKTESMIHGIKVGIVITFIIKIKSICSLNKKAQCIKGAWKLLFMFFQLQNLNALQEFNDNHQLSHIKQMDVIFSDACAFNQIDCMSIVHIPTRGKKNKKNTLDHVYTNIPGSC